MKNAIAATLLALGATVAHADMETKTFETLMHAHALEVFGLSLLEPAQANSTLQYTFTVNPNDGSFSYQALPGQTYNGMSYSINAQGRYDLGTQSYSWSGSGMLGNANLEQDGHAYWLDLIEDPGQINAEVDPPVAGTEAGVKIFSLKRDGLRVATYTGTDVVKDGKSTGSGEFRLATRLVGEKVSMTDTVVGDTKTITIWEEEYEAYPVELSLFPILNQDGSYTGTSTVTIAAVPEPATWMLVAAGVFVLFMRRSAGEPRLTDDARPS